MRVKGQVRKCWEEEKCIEKRGPCEHGALLCQHYLKDLINLIMKATKSIVSAGIESISKSYKCSVYSPQVHDEKWG